MADTAATQPSPAAMGTPPLVMRGHFRGQQSEEATLNTPVPVSLSSWGLGWSLLPCSYSTRCSRAPWSWLLDPSGSGKGRNWFRSQGEKPSNPLALLSHRRTAARECCCASTQSHTFHTSGTRLFSRNWQVKPCETNKATGWANPAFSMSYFSSSDHYMPTFWSKCNVPMSQEKGKMFKNTWLSQKHPT